MKSMTKAEIQVKNDELSREISFLRQELDALAARLQHAAKPLVRIWRVRYDVPAGEFPTEDGTRTAEFGRGHAAQRFAESSTCYSRPAVARSLLVRATYAKVHNLI